MYCLVLYAWFREEQGLYPQMSFEFFSDRPINQSFIDEKKRGVGSRWGKGQGPGLLVHGIFTQLPQL
jgi:hypothetical protein